MVESVVEMRKRASTLRSGDGDRGNEGTQSNGERFQGFFHPTPVLYVKGKMRILWNLIGTPMRQKESRKVNIKPDPVFSRTFRCFPVSFYL